ncbi:hypothetical protein COX58_01475, partial [archaeon CG_4_10_14_0_2_um_filter_Archaea_38_6]
GYIFEKDGSFNEYHLVHPGARSVLEQVYLINFSSGKIVKCEATGIIPRETFNLANLEKLIIKAPMVKSLELPKFMYNFGNELHRDYDYYCSISFSDYFKGETSSDNGCVKYSYKMSKFARICLSENVGIPFSSELNSDEMHDLISGIKSRFLKKLLLLDSKQCLILSGNVQNLRNLELLEIHGYNKAVIPENLHIPVTKIF